MKHGLTSLLSQFRWTPYDTPELQALIPDWMRSQVEIYTWRSAVLVVSFNFMHMHHIDRGIRQYGGEQPIPRSPVDVTSYMSNTGRGEDVWWPDRLSTWYTGGGIGGPQRQGRFLSHAGDLANPQWNLAPPDIPHAAMHSRDDLVMPDDAPAPRKRQVRETRPRQAGPMRGKLSLRDQRKRARMMEVGAIAHVAKERAEEQQEYDRQDEPGDDVQYGESGPDDYGAHDQPGFGIHEQHDFQPTQDPTISPSGIIMFSPVAARAYPSPYHAGTSSHPEYGSDHPSSFMPQTQEHTGLDELLYQKSTCPPAEFSSIVSTYRMTRAQHDGQGASSSHAPPPPPSSNVQHGPWVPTYSSPLAMGFSVFDSSRIGSEYATPSSYHVPSSYHSQSFHGHSAPLPSMTQSQQSSVDLSQSVEAPQAPQPHRPTRAVRPPRCGTGGHMQPCGGQH
ncbi:hypothetical protein PIB30_052882 [Stylosanthes scabra]|uniref:Uncharacterized protein n=1 Tax=Stylosanthes scabra TaxID=79078 RepID=A0ABU6YFR7_9FABA|nr:hypothetical protein [Stylosanthes scabra]